MQNQKKLRRLRLTDEAGEHGIGMNDQVLRGFGSHWHDYYEIEIVADGHGTFSCNNVPYRFTRGNMTLLTPADFHMMQSDAPVNLINIEFGAEWITEPMRRVMNSPNFEKIRKLSEGELQQVLSAVDLFKNEYESEGMCIQQLLEYIFSKFLQGRQQKRPKDNDREYTKGVMRAISYMEQHFPERITLETLSKISGYHPTYFSKMFCKVTGESYIERLTSLRINYAKMMLKNGATVSEARFASGFGSHSNFLTVFKKYCRMSPSEYRKKYQDQKKP